MGVRVGVIGHGGLLRDFSFARPISGSGDLPSDMPRRPETWVSLCNLMMALRAALLSSGLIVPRVTMGRITPSG